MQEVLNTPIDELTPHDLFRMGLIARIAIKPRKCPKQEAMRLEVLERARMLAKKRAGDVAAYIRSYKGVRGDVLSAHYEARFGRDLPDIANFACSPSVDSWIETQDFLIDLWDKQAKAELLIRGTLLELLRNEPSPNKRRWLRIKVATPPWVDFDKIAELVMERNRLNQETGVRHEIDHIIPLAGKNVCGLHVHWNMRVITSSENRRKGAKFSEEMLDSASVIS